MDCQDNRQDIPKSALAIVIASTFAAGVSCLNVNFSTSHRHPVVVVAAAAASSSGPDPFAGQVRFRLSLRISQAHPMAYIF